MLILCDTYMHTQLHIHTHLMVLAVDEVGPSSVWPGTKVNTAVIKFQGYNGPNKK